MKVQSRFFGRNDPLKPQAERLVQSCAILSVTAFVPITDLHPFLKTHSPEEWDFFATVGAVVVGLLNLMNSVPKDRFRALYSFVGAELKKWNPQGEDAVMDCRKFMADAANAASPIDSLGMWVLWNMLQRVPTRDEANAASAIGSALAAPLHDWWD